MYPPPSGPPLAAGLDQDSGFFEALFDFSFDRYVTPSLVKILYVLTTIFLGLVWLGSVAFLLLGGVKMTDSPLTRSISGVPMVLGFLDLLLGWIPGVLLLAQLRTRYEFYVATVRTNVELRAIHAALRARRIL